jgi:hypothetical protein
MYIQNPLQQVTYVRNYRGDLTGPFHFDFAHDL